MGKVKKLKPSQIASKVSLEQDIEQTKFAQSKNRNKVRIRHDEDEQFVESSLSNKILKLAREQQRTLEPEIKPQCSFHINDEDSESDDEQNDIQKYDALYDNMGYGPEVEEVIKSFSNPKPRKRLADVIGVEDPDLSLSDDDESVQELHPGVENLFKGCGEFMKKYRSGKLPHAVKFIYKYSNWEQLLHLTDPPHWSAAGVYQATRIFASNFNEKMAQKYYELVLLPRVRDDLGEYKKLNFHLYQSLKKAIYKPKAFVKGIIIPLLESGDCTLREAIIVGSLLAKYSFPSLHSFVAIFLIAEMEYTGANSIFLRIFFDKKYALPLKIVDAVCDHFMRFQKDERNMPVLWHQSLLTFLQRYKDSILTKDRDLFYKLLKKQYHPGISPEVERELRHAKCRDSVATKTPMDLD